MKYVIEAAGSTTVVTPLGDALDAQCAKAFRQSMETELKGKGNVLFDLRHVRFVDSSGLGAILGCQRMIEGGGGGVRLCGLGPDVRKAVELVRMDRLMDVHRDREEALASGS